MHAQSLDPEATGLTMDTAMVILILFSAIISLPHGAAGRGMGN